MEHIVPNLAADDLTTEKIAFNLTEERLACRNTEALFVHSMFTNEFSLFLATFHYETYL